MKPMYELVIFNDETDCGHPRHFRTKAALVDYLHDVFPVSFKLDRDYSSFADIHEFLYYSDHRGVLREIHPEAFERF